MSINLIFASIIESINRNMLSLKTSSHEKVQVIDSKPFLALPESRNYRSLGLA